MTQNLSALIHSQNVLTLPDEAEGWWFLTQSINQIYFCIAQNHKIQFVSEGFTNCTGVTSSVSMGDVTPSTSKTGSVYHVTPLARGTLGYLVLYWLSLAKHNSKPTILNHTAFFGNLLVVYFNKLLRENLSSLHENCCF